jgi:hypothetical protein
MNNVHVCGQGIHNYRICAPNGRVLLHANKIGSDPAFHQRRRGAKANNSAHISRMSNNIAKNLAKFPATQTGKQLDILVNKVITNRTQAWMSWRPEYNREEAAYYAHIAQLATIAKNLRKQKLNANANAVNQQIQNATQFFFSRQAVINHIRHADQISYWKWVRNSVVPEVKKRLRIQARN